RPWKSEAQGPIIVVEPPPRAPVVHELAPPPPPEPAPVPPPALDIVSRPPGARVVIDSRRLDESTPIRARELPPGSHAITVERAGYQPRQLSLVLQPGEHRTL